MPQKTGPTKRCPKCGNETLRPSAKTPAGKTRWRCRQHGKHCYSTTNPDAPYQDQKGNRKAADRNPQFKRKLGGIKRFVVTAAQNATPVNWGFWWALKAYCEENGAELVVIPIRYKNATSRWTASQANEEWWLRDVAEYELQAEHGIVRKDFYAGNLPAELTGDFDTFEDLLDYHAARYLYNQRKKLNENLVLLGDIKTQPTATKPLSGFESITAGESGILGHTKLQLETIPTPQGRLPKILTTTGAITVPNYTDSKAGKKGEFHHASAAVGVDIVGKKFFMYQLNAERNGRFQHLEKVYNPDGQVMAGPRVASVAFGDTHRKFIDPKVFKATFGPGGIVPTLDPEQLVFHDLHDGYAENPHHEKRPFIAVAKQKSGFDDVRKEVIEDVRWLEEVAAGRLAVIVPSNHDNMLYRWLEKSDWRADPLNAEFYLETALAMVRGTTMTASGSSTPDPFVYWVEKLWEGDPEGLRCLRMDESHVIAGIEHGFHGDKGPNGARGTRNNFRRIGVKTVIGHAHSPGIEEGCYQAGTSTPLSLEYTGGPSSWMNAHVVTYQNGKRSLLFIIDGEWKF